MNNETVVHLLRHGEVENPGHVLYGLLPGFRLSDLGEQMAKAAASAVTTRDITLVVASPLERAQQTAEPIAAQFDLPIGTDDRLIETSNFFEGKRVGISTMRDPRNWWALRNPLGPSWGERYPAIVQRMSAAVDAAREQAAGHEAVLVSHQVAIWTLRRHLERKRLWHDPRQRQCGLASLTSFHFEGDTLIKIDYSEPAAHLIASSLGTRNANEA